MRCVPVRVLDQNSIVLDLEIEHVSELVLGAALAPDSSARVARLRYGLLSHIARWAPYPSLKVLM